MEANPPLRKGSFVMAVLRISRPKRGWAVSPATVLPAAWLVRLFGLHFNFTVVLDDHSAGKIGNEQVRVFNVDPGEHRLYLRFLLVRRSKKMQISLGEDVERDFLCGSNGMGWPTLREASPEEVAELRGSSISKPPKPGASVSPN
jgi:hypothetical protein